MKIKKQSKLFIFKQNNGKKKEKMSKGNVFKGKFKLC